MEYTIENSLLKVTLTTDGAQVISVVDKADGTEYMWQGDPAVWSGRAPILFPYAGRLPGGSFTAKGKQYSGKPHGFARNMEHRLVCQREDTVILELTDSDETLALWPYHFRLESTFSLAGRTLYHTLKVENRDREKMPFGIGFHPAFRLPFDGKHTAKDYELRFDALESPLCLDTSEGGLVGKNHYYLGKNIKTIAIDEKLFENDSHLMTGLHSQTLGLYEKDSGRSVVCSIAGFPYVLIWSMPGMPQFVCIEPWHSTPSPVEGTDAWEEKPAAAILNPQEHWQTTLSTEFGK